MKTFQSILPAFGLIAVAQAWGSDWNQTYWTTTTVTTDVYTTYCPQATTFTQGNHTYTATASETITITDCPCTYVTSTPTAPPTTAPTAPPTTTYTWVPPPPPVYNTTVVPPPVWTTETVSSYTTYCPAPTSVVAGNHTYTVSSATTLTITECPCTVSYTKPPTSYTTETLSYITTYCPAPTTVSYSSATYAITTPGVVVIPITTVAPVPTTYPGGESSAALTTPSTVYVPTKTPVGPTASQSSPVQVTANAAMKLDSGIGAMAVVGLAAMLL